MMAVMKTPISLHCLKINNNFGNKKRKLKKIHLIIFLHAMKLAVSSTTLSIILVSISSDFAVKILLTHDVMSLN